MKCERDFESRLEYLRYRLKMAKARAVYWSGKPTYGRAAKATQTSRRNEKYEIALCDVHNLSRSIEAITGKKIPRYDPRADFQKKYTAVLNSLPKRKIPTQSNGGKGE